MVAFFSASTHGLTRWKVISSWWAGIVPRLGGSQEPSKLSSCFCFGADPIDGRRKVVDEDQHLAMERFIRRQIQIWGSQGESDINY